MDSSQAKENSSSMEAMQDTSMSGTFGVDKSRSTKSDQVQLISSKIEDVQRDYENCDDETKKELETEYPDFIRALVNHVKKHDELVPARDDGTLSGNLSQDDIEKAEHAKVKAAVKLDHTAYDRMLKDNGITPAHLNAFANKLRSHLASKEFRVNDKHTARLSFKDADAVVRFLFVDLLRGIIKRQSELRHILKTLGTPTNASEGPAALECDKKAGPKNRLIEQILRFSKWDMSNVSCTDARYKSMQVCDEVVGQLIRNYFAADISILLDTAQKDAAVMVKLWLCYGDGPEFPKYNPPGAVEAWIQRDSRVSDDGVDDLLAEAKVPALLVEQWGRGALALLPFANSSDSHDFPYGQFIFETLLREIREKFPEINAVFRTVCVDCNKNLVRPALQAAGIDVAWDIGLRELDIK